MDKSKYTLLSLDPINAIVKYLSRNILSIVLIEWVQPLSNPFCAEPTRQFS